MDNDRGYRECIFIVNYPLPIDNYLPGRACYARRKRSETAALIHADVAEFFDQRGPAREIGAHDLRELGRRGAGGFGVRALDALADTRIAQRLVECSGELIDGGRRRPGGREHTPPSG